MGSDGPRHLLSGPRPGHFWGSLGVLLEISWVPFGDFWEVLGALGGRLGLLLGASGCSWRALWDLWGPFLAYFRSHWRFLECYQHFFCTFGVVVVVL